MAEVATQANTTLVCTACQEARPSALSCIHTFTGLYETKVSYTAPCEHPDHALLNSAHKREHAAFGQARARQSRPSLLCPAKDCGAPVAIYATGSYLDHAGEQDWLFLEAICTNGHSYFARRLDPEIPAPDSREVPAASTTPDARALFEQTVERRYPELIMIARNALDGGKIPGYDACVQQAVEALLKDGAYASCADEGEMFGQLVVTVQNRAKATIKRWARNKKRDRSLTTEHVRRRRWSDGDDEIVGKGAERELRTDDNAIDKTYEELRPRPDRTSDLRIDAKWTLFEGAVPIDVQMVLAGEVTREELMKAVTPYNRHLQRTILDGLVDDSRERLAKRLEDYRPAPGLKRECRDGRWVPDMASHRTFIRRWLEEARAAFKRAWARRRDDIPSFQRFSITPLTDP